MYIKEANGVKLCVFENFERTGLVRHCVSTRVGGVSSGCYSSLNLRLNGRDERALMLENFARLCCALNTDVDSLVFSDQTHNTDIYIVGQNDRGKGITRESDIRSIDALITSEPGVALTTFYADCVPVLFLDTRKGVIAAAHAGWRGTADAIAAKTVAKMTEAFGCKPHDILAGIGPSIGACCFEVDEPVAAEFRTKLPLSERFIKPSESTEGKFYIDLRAINAQLLTDAGIQAENIETADLCTKCEDALFYSHRRDGNNRGSMAAVIELKRS